MKWISVKDSLPGYCQPVLWVYENGVYCGTLGPSDTGLKFYHADDETEPNHISDVEWWMPFPEPPKDNDK